MMEKNEAPRTKFVTSACGCTSCVNNKDYVIYRKYKGKIIYFCNHDCVDEFLEDKEEFLKGDHFLIEFDTLEDATD